MEPSPLLPVEPSVRESDLPAGRRRARSCVVAPEDVEAVASVLRARNVVDEDLDRDVVWSAKREILTRAFAVRNDSRRLFDEFVAAQGDALRDFATWVRVGREARR